MILTPWTEFKNENFLNLIASQLKKIPIIDPYGLIPLPLIESSKLQVYSLGRYSNYDESKQNG
jgi:hypothetical protein